MQKVLLSLIAILFSIQVSAQDNIADIAHAMIKSIKKNDLAAIQPFFINASNAYNILPKTAVGLSAKEQNTKFVKPMHKKFADKFNDIQAQIKDNNVQTSAIDLQAYKLGKADKNFESKVMAMSLFFNYKGTECTLPITVIEIDEKWYVLEMIDTQNLFKKKQ